MANLLWGNVYYKDIFSGCLREEPGERISFTYDSSYIDAGYPAIAHTLPLQKNAHINNVGLHPFFDNLVSEGWLEQAQSRLLGKRAASRFELLLAFGFDCAGAVSIIDPDPSGGLTKAMLDMEDAKEMALFTSRASLSGIQPKLAIIEKNGKFYSARINEVSTHIAKFSSPGHTDLIENEYLSTLAFRFLLPDDNVVEQRILSIEGINEPALLIKRFDRSPEERIHFEEFNQLLNRRSKEKYEGAHKDMAQFIRHTKGCVPTQIYQLYKRILAGLLLGNTDMHFKNFAMFHTSVGLRLTPSYDQVAAALYGYKTVALALGGSHNVLLAALKPRNIIKLGEEFELSSGAINMAVRELEKNIEAAKQVIFESKLGKAHFKNSLIKLMEKRWNGTFALIGQSLSKKP